MSTESSHVSIRTAAQRLGVHENTVRRYVDRGQLRAVRLPSGVRRVDRDDLDALINVSGVAAEDDAHTPEQLLREQGLQPVRIEDGLSAPEVWPDADEMEAFLAMTYAERDRDR